MLAELKNSLFQNMPRIVLSFKLSPPTSLTSERETQPQASCPEIIMSKCPSPTKTEHDEPFDEVDQSSKYKLRRTFTRLGRRRRSHPLPMEDYLHFPSFSNSPSFSWQASRKNSVEQKFQCTSRDSTFYSKTQRRHKFLMNQYRVNLLPQN